MAKLTVKSRKNHPKKSRKGPTQEAHKRWLTKELRTILVPEIVCIRHFSP